MLPERKLSKGPFETRTSIGRRCKHGNMLSRAVLIAREAWPGRQLPPDHRPASSTRQPTARLAPDDPNPQNCHSILAGDDSARATPVPIPNTVVKPRSADGTAEATRWESTTSPALTTGKPP